MRSAWLASARMSNCFCTQPDHSCRRIASSGGAPSTAAMVMAGYGLANALTNSHPAPRRASQLVTHPCQKAPHGRAPPLPRSRREGRADQRPQPPVPVTAEVQDVGVDHLPEPAAGDAEQIGDLTAGKTGLLRPQEELPRLAIQHDMGEGRPGQPALLAQPRQALVEDLAAQARLVIVEERQLDVADRPGRSRRLDGPCRRAGVIRHGRLPPPLATTGWPAVPPREVPPRELPHTAQSSTPRSTAGRAVPRAAQYRGPRSTAGREVLHAAKYCTPRS